MTGSDRRFEGGDLRELKGVEDPWRVYRLVPETVNGDVVASRRPSMVPLYTRRQRKRLVVGLAAVTALALAFSTTYVLTRSEAEVVVGENAVGVIGPGDDRASAAVEVGARPTSVAGGRDLVWVTNSTAGSVSRIDPRTSSSVQITVGASPSGVAVGARAVWVANSGDSTVSRIDPETSRTTTIEVRPGPTGIVVAFGSVWVTNALDASVTEIDPDTNTVANKVDVGASPTGIAAGAGYLWVTNQGDGTVTRFDPRTRQKDSPIDVGAGPVGIAVAGGAAWVANNLEGSLSRIDVEDLSVDTWTLDKDGGAYGVAAAGGAVWVSNEHARTLMQVTAKTFRLAETVPMAGAPLGLAFVGDDLWFTSAAGSALHRGGVLTMVGTSVGWNGDPAVLDPLTVDDSWGRLAAMTHDGLVGFRRAGGVRGVDLVPDLATAVPEPTDGGRTYTFHLRKGVRYSTGEPVRAGDIQRGIERTVAHGTLAATNYYVPAIVGAKRCRAAVDAAAAAEEPHPDCDLSTGITADDGTGTVTFHLTTPTPEFRFQLALANASAVPQGTPLDMAPGAFVPGTGPYMIESYTPKQDTADGHGRLELVRNPHFREWSPAAQPAGFPDRIVLDTGYSEAEAVQRVTDGRADFLWQGRPMTDVDRLRTQHASLVHTGAGLGTDYVFLNATKPPFDDLDARRAVAYALDRKALAGLGRYLSDAVTCQFVPPGFAAYQRYCPFTLGGGPDGRWEGIDLATAQDLVRRSGTRGDEVVVVTGPDRPAREAGQDLVEQLRRLGYRASPKIGYDLVGDPTNDWNAGIQGYYIDYPAVSNFLEPVGLCAGVGNYSRACDREIDGKIKAAVAQQVTDPGAASDLWADIDRAVVDAAAVIPYANFVRHDLVSRRVGNTLMHPVTGALIPQMWVQ